MTTTREPLDLLAFNWDADYALELARDRRVQALRNGGGRRIIWTVDGGHVSAAIEQQFIGLRNLGYLDVPGYMQSDFQAPVRLTGTGAALLAQWQAHPAYAAAHERHFGLKVD